MSVPDSITDSEAAAMQPLASSVDFIVPAKIEAGDTVVVLGQGTMGLGIMQVSRAYGAGKMIVTDLHDETLAVSRESLAQTSPSMRMRPIPKRNRGSDRRSSVQT